MVEEAREGTKQVETTNTHSNKNLDRKLIIGMFFHVLRHLEHLYVNQEKLQILNDSEGRHFLIRNFFMHIHYKRQIFFSNEWLNELISLTTKNTYSNSPAHHDSCCMLGSSSYSVVCKGLRLPALYFTFIGTTCWPGGGRCIRMDSANREKMLLGRRCRNTLGIDEFHTRGSYSWQWGALL